jgi:ABC-2 type transport system permease protein
MSGSFGERSLASSPLAITARIMWARTRADMQYRLSFALRIAAGCVSLLGDVFVLWALERRFGSIGGWTIGPLMFLYGTSSLAFRISDAFLGGAVEKSGELVRTGELDSMLTRPVGLLWQLAGEGFAVRRVFQLLSVIPFLVLGLTYSDIDWSLLTVGALMVIVVNATVVFGSIFTIVNTLSFWSPNTTEIGNAFTYGGATAAQFPLHVLDGWIRAITFSVVPVAFPVYVPSFLVLEGVPNPLGINDPQGLLSLLTGIPLALCARVVWRAGVRHYGSTGS